MKKLLLVLALLLSLTLVSCASDDSKDPDKSNPNNDASQDDGSNAEEVAGEIIDKIMDSIGEDLAERAKAAGYRLETRIRHYKFELPEGHTLTEREQEQAFDKIFVETIIYSPEGSTTYGNNTVDCDLLRELQYAILDAGVFGLSEEDIVKGKSESYTAGKSLNIYLKNGDVSVNILEAPFGNSAMVQIGDINNSRILYLYHKNDWTLDYDWGELDN